MPQARTFSQSAAGQFLSRGPVSPRVHGVLDYLLAATLIAGPLVLNFADSVATVFVLIVGAAAAVLAVGTAWSTGIVRVIPPIVHGALDIGATIALIAAPFVLGFSQDGIATGFCLIVGVGGLVATLMTRFVSDLPVSGAVSAQPAF